MCLCKPIESYCLTGREVLKSYANLTTGLIFLGHLTLTLIFIVVNRWNLQSPAKLSTQKTDTRKTSLTRLLDNIGH